MHHIESTELQQTSIETGAPPFANRRAAGALLATRLLEHRGHHALVLALPRGGVPVASEIARRIKGELDVLVVRKLGAPGQEELAIGAITSDGTCVFNRDVLHALQVSEGYLNAEVAFESAQAKMRERIMREGVAQIERRGRVVIVVDDGLATGATMRAAIAALRKEQPKQIVIAVPVGATETCEMLETEGDEVVCLYRAQRLGSVGEHYDDFAQTSDEEVVHLLREARGD